MSEGWVGEGDRKGGWEGEGDRKGGWEGEGLTADEAGNHMLTPICLAEGTAL